MTQLSTAAMILLTLLATGFNPEQQSRQDRQDPAWVTEGAPKRIVYALPGMELAGVKTAVYKQVGTMALQMDVYTPAGVGPGKLLPAVVFIHGGPLPDNLATPPTRWGQFISYGQLAAASGLVGVTFNHRLYGLDRFPDAESDLADLISYIRKHGESLGIDKDHIALWAFSGGGPLLSLAMREPRPYIRCLVSYYALLDLPAIRKLIPDSVTDETLRHFSPAHILATTGTIPPMFIGRAALDHPGQNVAVDRFLQVALARNLPITLANHPAGHHGFDIEDHDQQSRAIICETLEFIRANN